MPTRSLLPLLLLPSIHAIDLANPLDNCPPATYPLASNRPFFNATNTLPLALSPSPDQGWYLTLGLTDERAPNTLYDRAPTRQSLSVLVSVPESATATAASLCVYRFAQPDRPASADGSCAGVLDDGCVRALQEVRAVSDGACPTVDVGGACNGLQLLHSTPDPIDISKKLCSTNETVADVPADHRTYVTRASGALNDSDVTKSSFEKYDEDIVRPAPVLVTARFNGSAAAGSKQGASKVMCVAPAKVVAGSRPVTAAAGRGVVSVGWVVAVAAVVVTGLM